MSISANLPDRQFNLILPGVTNKSLNIVLELGKSEIRMQLSFEVPREKPP
jgi:hypothetical protein